MRNYMQETEKRVVFIREVLADAGADAIVFGNSGGKDCALVGILCRRACKDVLGVAMPCQSSRNFGEDLRDAKALSEVFNIPLEVVDLTAAKEAVLAAAGGIQALSDAAVSNIAPRLRMTTLYLLAQSRGALVAGTGNRSERHMGYFTKWGDGAFDFNPIADLTVGEIYEFLHFLGAPENIIAKAPSAGLFEGQTDEKEMGVTYAAIDALLLTGETDPDSRARIGRAHAATEHKRCPARLYGDEVET